MLSADQLNERIFALEEALHQGVSTVTYDGRTVTYRSLDAMTRILRGLKAELAAAQGTTAAQGRRCAVFSRGY